jgi:hypothetical protein
MVAEEIFVNNFNTISPVKTGSYKTSRRRSRNSICSSPEPNKIISAPQHWLGVVSIELQLLLYSANLGFRINKR